MAALKLIPVLLLSAYSSLLWAVGEEIPLLTEIAGTAKEAYSNAKDVLEETKYVSKEVKQASSFLEDIRNEYQFINDFSLETELRIIKDDALGLTNVDDWSNATTMDQKLNLIQGEIGLRFKNPVNKVKKADRAKAVKMLGDERDVKKALKKIETESKIRDKFYKNGLRPEGKSLKDLQKQSTAASSIIASDIMDKKTQKRKNEIMEREELISQIQFDFDFQRYINGAQDSEYSGIYAVLVRSVLNPDAIYMVMGSLVIVADIAVWLFIIFMASRLFIESLKTLSFSSSMAKAILAQGKTAVLILIYANLGLFLFSIVFLVRMLFDGFYNVADIHTEMATIKGRLDISYKDYFNYFGAVLDFAASFTSLIAGPVSWLTYHLTSMVYIVIVQLIDVLFAVVFVLIYVWGFIAIATNSFSGYMNLSKGWILSFMFLVAWGIVEYILMALNYSLVVVSGSSLVGAYGGSAGFTDVSIWYGMYGMTLMLIMLFKILAPFIAFKLVSNQPVGSEVGMAAAAPAALMMSKVLDSVYSKSGAGVGSMLPNASDGGRRRDGLARVIGDAANANVTDTYNAMKRGIGSMFNSGSGGK